MASLALLSACGSSPSAAPSGAATHSAAPPAPRVSSAQAKSLQHVTIALPVQNEAFTEIFVAKGLGLFQKHGLNPTIVTMKGPTAMAGLQTGSVDFWTGAGGGVRAAETGLPVRAVFVSDDAPLMLLVGARGMTNVAQLKGKAVAVKSPLDLTVLATQEVLGQHGVASNTYHLLYAGGTPEQIGFLDQGKAQAAMIEIEPALAQQQKGYPILESALGLRVVGAGLVTSMNEIRTKPGLIRKMIAVEKDALHYMVTDRAGTIAIMERAFHYSAAITSRIYDLLKPTWVPSGIPSKATIANEIRYDTGVLTATHAHFVSPITESRFADLSFLTAARGGSSAS